MAANDVNIRIKAIDDTKRAFNSVGGSLRGLKNAVFSVQGALSALAGGAVVKGIVDTNVEFQRLEASLKTFTGSAANAKQEFDALSAFAAKTPYELQDVVGAFNILVARGINPSEEALTAFGNIASGTGKTLNQFIEAVADAATGEFERLKEFGIKANKEGDKIKFTFGGVTTEVKNNAEAINGYLKELGATKFAGAMEEQSKTLGGAFSNLKDAIATTAKLIGESGLNDFILDITMSITELVNQVNKAVKGKGVFGGIKDLLFGTDEEQALKGAIDRTNKELGRFLGEGNAKQFKGNQILWDRYTDSVNAAKRALTDIDRASMKVQDAAAPKIGKTLAPIVVTPQITTEQQKAIDDYNQSLIDAQVHWASAMTAGEQQARNRQTVIDTTRQKIVEMNKELFGQYSAGRAKRQQTLSGEFLAIADYAETSKNALIQYADAAMNMDKALEDVKMGGIKSMEDGFVDLITGTKNVADAFRSMATSVVASLARMWVQQAITGPLANMLGLPGKAIGGSVQSGKPYMVGERGPEMFVPNQSGSIVPNNKLGGSGGVVVNQTINVSTGVQQTVRAEVMSLMPQIAGAAKAAVADAKLRGGSYAAALR